jgi:uncharacterized protein YegL
MPKLTDNLETHKLTGHFGFSATKIDDLAASEYTLVSIIVDESGSVAAFRQPLIEALKSIVNACKYSPRADNLMVRLVSFDSKLTEVHGFKLLSTINLADYDGLLTSGGTTALFDASENGVRATSAYGKDLVKNDYGVNGIVFVLTDGGDNASTFTANQVHDALAAAVQEETLESLVSVLIGVNVSEPYIKQYLDDFHKLAGFTQFVDIGSATPQKLARLAEFVSKSISAQSQSLGSGGASKSLVF